MTEKHRDAVPVKAFATAKAFERWLDANHERSDGIWLKPGQAGGAGGQNRPLPWRMSMYGRKYWVALRATL